MSRFLYCVALSLTAALVTSNGLTTDAGESVQFNVRDLNGNFIPCRIHLKNENLEPVQVPGLPFWHDHFVCSGNVSVELSAGSYTWQIERGPEWARASGSINVKAGEPTAVEVALKRIANLSDEGWYSGDMHIHRSVEHIKPLMLAEDLNFAPVIGWWNTPAKNAVAVQKTEFPFDSGRVYTIMAGEDEREGGALLFYGLNKPLDLSVRSREFPSPMTFVQEARKRNEQVWLDIEKPFWWDVPTWLASGQMNSIGIANNHMCRTEMLASEAWGKPRDPSRLPSPLGNGYWSQEIYYHILNAGIRLPPSAGSASGVLPNPVGYNRVYVQLGQQSLTRDAWFTALSQGQCFVTNGPLLRVEADKQLPGSVLELSSGTPRSIALSMRLTTSDPVSAIEIIYNGKVVRKIPCSSATDQLLSATLDIQEPGWFLVRAIADVEDTFRFASTAPWYLESSHADEQHHGPQADHKRRAENEQFESRAGSGRISKVSVQFFLDWVNERIERLNADMPDAEQRASVLQWHLKAREFWLNRLEAANADLGRPTNGEPSSPSNVVVRSALRLTGIVEQLGDFPKAMEAKVAIGKASSLADLDEAVAALTLFSVSVNPESRVKIVSTQARVPITVEVPKRFLVKCENTAGITAPLKIQALDVSTEPPQFARWCTVRMLEDPVVSSEFTGELEEYKIVELTFRNLGLYEVRFVAEAGQGTQDLGFRASADLLIEVSQNTSSIETKE